MINVRGKMEIVSGIIRGPKVCELLISCNYGNYCLYIQILLFKSLLKWKAKKINILIEKNQLWIKVF